MNQPNHTDPIGEPETGPPNDSQQPLIQHLIELRQRLLRSAACIVLVFLGLVYFANDIYAIVSAPLRIYLPDTSSMIATGVVAPLLTPLKLTFFVSIFASMPYLLYQMWSFIAPALYQHEKRIALPLFFSSVFLFYLGMAFAYFVVFDLIFSFLATIAPAEITFMPDITNYLQVVLKLFFAFGLAFEIPVATFLLIRAGISTPESLASKRPYVVVGCFIVGMLLTPPDLFSQTLLALPMWLLFELGIIFARLTEKNSEAVED